MTASSQPGPALSPAVQRLAPALFEKSGGEQFGLSASEFARILEEVAQKYLPADAPAKQVEELLGSLRIEELALARACAAGDENAWEAFLTSYREKLYGAAYAIAKADATAHELADSLYADLYGTATRDGRRVSKLNSYMGRGSLEGWLRTVLAQEYVNRYRSGRRLVSLEERSEAGAQFAAAPPQPASPADSRLEAATDAALASLGAEDRFLLAAYFLDGRTLAEIARMLGVHESTVSRKVDKTVKAVRKRIRDALIARGMTRRQADEALETDVRDLAVNVRATLTQETAAAPFSKEEIGADAPGKVNG
jgi:RNA polymerase sigma-70 factor (ECF subfamily)